VPEAIADRKPDMIGVFAMVPPADHRRARLVERRRAGAGRLSDGQCIETINASTINASTINASTINASKARRV
jgi:hypothetical protein